MDCFRELFYGSTMTCLILKVARLAHQTFSQVSGSPKDRKQFLDNLNKLKGLVHQVRKADVSLQPSLTSEASNLVWTQQSKDAPVSYIEIFENEVFSLGIFVLKHGATIPLHDHPDMYGLIKVLHGTVAVQSYSRISEDARLEVKEDAVEETGGPADGGMLSDELSPNVVAVKKLPLLSANEDSEPCCLTPDEANYHEVRSVGGSAAFLDILAPPYHYPVRKCHYFEEVSSSTSNVNSRLVENLRKTLADSHTLLIEVPWPDDYWSKSEPYLGPDVDF